MLDSLSSSFDSFSFTTASECSSNHRSSISQSRGSPLAPNTPQAAPSKVYYRAAGEAIAKGGADAVPCSPPKLLFEFSDAETPFSRPPLTERIAELAEQFPGLFTLRSSDIHGSSW